MVIKHQFEPVIDNTSEILILGSFPSVKSRENEFYYMNKQNRFWKVLSSLYGIDLENCSRDQKILKLKELKIALYDVIEECEITGSQDSSIRNAKIIDLEELIKKTNIQRIYLNGNKAYNLFIKHFPMYSKIACKLPSTSPANAVYTLEKLVEEWNIIKQ